MGFDNKTVLITGGRRRHRPSGRRAVRTREGAEVIVTGRDEVRGLRGRRHDRVSTGGRARFIAADISEPGGAQQLAQSAGQIDVLVNNAGIFPFGASHEIPIEDVRAVLDFNVVTPFTLVAALVPGMVQRRSGAIVNVSTMVASFGLPGMSAYGASKAALELLTKAWGS